MAAAIAGSRRGRYPDAHEGHGSAHDAGRPVLRPSARRRRGSLSRTRRDGAEEAGVPAEAIAVDPGLGLRQEPRRATSSCCATSRPSARSASPSPSAHRARDSSAASRASPTTPPPPTGCRARSPPSRPPPRPARRSSASTTSPSRSRFLRMLGRDRAPGAPAPTAAGAAAALMPSLASPARGPRAPELRLARRPRHRDRRGHHVRPAAPDPRHARGADGARALRDLRRLRGREPAQSRRADGDPEDAHLLRPVRDHRALLARAAPGARRRSAARRSSRCSRATTPRRRFPRSSSPSPRSRPAASARSIVLERREGLKTYIENGSAIDAAVSYELLVTVFAPGTPLHDGAVIVSGDRIAAAASFLPLSLKEGLPKRFGTRHRAADRHHGGDRRARDPRLRGAGDDLARPGRRAAGRPRRQVAAGPPLPRVRGARGSRERPMSLAPFSSATSARSSWRSRSPASTWYLLTGAAAGAHLRAELPHSAVDRERADGHDGRLAAAGRASTSACAGAFTPLRQLEPVQARGRPRPRGRRPGREALPARARRHQRAARTSRSSRISPAGDPRRARRGRREDAADRGRALRTARARRARRRGRGRAPATPRIVGPGEDALERPEPVATRARLASRGATPPSPSRRRSPCRPPGVRVREGQFVTVRVRIEPAPPPEPTARPTPARARERKAMKLFGTDGLRGKAGEFPLDPRLGAAARPRARPAPDVEAARRASSSAATRGSPRRGSSRTSPPGSRRAAAASPPPASSRRRASRSSSSSSARAAGIAVSASHNPYEDNGIKIFGPDGRKWPDEEEEFLERSLLEGRADGRSPRRHAAAARSRTRASSRPTSRACTPSVPERPRRLPVLMDAGNGAAFQIGPRALRRAGARVTAIHDAPDGRNINRGCGALHPETMARAMPRLGRGPRRRLRRRRRPRRSSPTRPAASSTATTCSGSSPATGRRAGGSRRAASSAP